MTETIRVEERYFGVDEPVQQNEVGAVKVWSIPAPSPMRGRKIQVDSECLGATIHAIQVGRGVNALGSPVPASVLSEMDLKIPTAAIGQIVEITYSMPKPGRFKAVMVADVAVDDGARSEPPVIPIVENAKAALLEDDMRDHVEKEMDRLFSKPS